MTALFALTVANIRSYVRDRAALFWTLAFPLIFIFMFGFIFQEGGQSRLTLGWVDEDGTPAAVDLRAGFDGQEGTELHAASKDEALAQMREGSVDAVILVPAGYGAAIAAGEAGTGGPTSVAVYTDPSRANLVASVYQSVQAVFGAVNLGGRPPLVVPQPETLQTENLNFISYFVPSMLGLSVMQVGIFAAIPLVADRVKLILKRLAATPLRRWQLVGSNVLMRLLIALDPGRDHRRRRRVRLRRRDRRVVPSDGPVHRPRRDGVPGARLRHRVVRQDRGFGERDDQRRPVPDDVPVRARSSRSIRCPTSCRASPG